jgi:hypothetical protein
MTENPRVNRYLKDKTFDRMDHALGRYFDPAGETHRNYFAVQAGSDLASEFNRSPYWALSGQQGDMAYYYVTDAGIAALKAHLAEFAPISAFVVWFDGHSRTIAAKSSSAAKYSYWMEISDICSGLTFIGFCRRARVRKLPSDRAGQRKAA